MFPRGLCAHCVVRLFVLVSSLWRHLSLSRSAVVLAHQRAFSAFGMLPLLLSVCLMSECFGLWVVSNAPCICIIAWLMCLFFWLKAKKQSNVLTRASKNAANTLSHSNIHNTKYIAARRQAERISM